MTGQMWYNTLEAMSRKVREVEGELVLPAEAVDVAAEAMDTDGKRLRVPVDPLALQELKDCFAELGQTKQMWLLTRYPFCDTDEEASRRMVDGGTPISLSTVRGWKQRDPAFRRCCDLMAGRLVDWVAHIVMSIEAGNAILGAIEARRLLERSWEDCDARTSTAKAQAAQASMDRFVGKKQQLDINVVKLSDLVGRS